MPGALQYKLPHSTLANEYTKVVYHAVDNTIVCDFDMGRHVDLSSNQIMYTPHVSWGATTVDGTLIAYYYNVLV